MGYRFPDSEPLLGYGKEIPRIADDVPGHSGCYIISGASILMENGKHLPALIVVMAFQFVDPCPAVVKNPSVAGKDQLDVKHIGLVQACQIGRQGVPVVEPALNIGCYVAENVVSGYKVLLSGFVEAVWPKLWPGVSTQIKR